MSNDVLIQWLKAQVESYVSQCRDNGQGPDGMYAPGKYNDLSLEVSTVNAVLLDFIIAASH